MRNGSTKRVRYADFDAAAAALDGKLAVSPLRGGPFLLEAVGIGLGDIAVRVGRHSPLLAQGALPADTVWAAFPVSETGPVLINGRAAGPHTVALYGAGALHELASHGEAGWALVALNRVYDTYGAIVDACCDAWNALMAAPERIASLATRHWAQVNA